MYGVCVDFCHGYSRIDAGKSTFDSGYINRIKIALIIFLLIQHTPNVICSSPNLLEIG